MHARRLRPLKERKIEIFGEEIISNKPSKWLIDGKLEVGVALQDITNTKSDAALCYIDERLEPLGEVSKRLMETGGPDVVTALCEIVSLNTCLGIPPIMCTTAGELESVSKLMFAVVNKELNEENLQSMLTQALTLTEEDVESIAIAFPDLTGLNQSVWSLSQTLVDSIVDYRKTNASNNLKRVDFVCNSFMQADVLRTVCNHLIGKQVTFQQELANADATGQVDQTETVELQAGVPFTEKQNEWFGVKDVLKRRKNRSRNQYLVVWEDNSQSWVDRKDLSDKAIEHFVATHRFRKRARK